MHLHGLITKSQSNNNPQLTYEIHGSEIQMGELCELGSQLRPHVVWFGEAVPMIEPAAQLCHLADIFIVIGTSLQVYPAAGLLDLVPQRAVKYLVDPNSSVYADRNFQLITKKAAIGVPELVNQLLKIEQ